MDPEPLIKLALRFANEDPDEPEGWTPERLELYRQWKESLTEDDQEQLSS